MFLELTIVFCILEIPLFHVLNARITFGNINTCEQEVPGVTKIENGPKPQCSVDDSCFDPPASYGRLGKTLWCTIDFSWMGGGDVVFFHKQRYSLKSYLNFFAFGIWPVSVTLYVSDPKNFNLVHNFWTMIDRDLIICTCTQLMKPFQMTGWWHFNFDHTLF